MGATNRPQDLDSAILRRMPTRFHINQPVSPLILAQNMFDGFKEMFSFTAESINSVVILINDHLSCVYLECQAEERHIETDPGE